MASDALFAAAALTDSLSATDIDQLAVVDLDDENPDYWMCEAKFTGSNERGMAPIRCLAVDQTAVKSQRWARCALKAVGKGKQKN